jgi:hypothetical protein
LQSGVGKRDDREEHWNGNRYSVETQRLL